MNCFVAIIVMNRDQTAYTRDCLISLRVLEYPNCRIVVVDNGSSDDSIRGMAREFPKVDFLWLKQNLGVAGGRNAGLRKVLPLGPKYVLFLDNDTFVAPDFLSLLVARMESDPHIGAVQPKIYYAAPPGRICSVGGKLYPRISHYRHPGSGQLDTGQFQSPAEIDIVSGCASLMRAKVFQEIGLLDETFSPYCHEDVDWSLRLRGAGYRLMVEPAAVVWHRVSAAPQNSPAKLEQLAKGHVLFLRFHTAFYDLPASLLWVSFHMARRYLFPALARADWQSTVGILRGIMAGMKQKVCPIEAFSTGDRHVPQELPPTSPPPKKRTVLLAGVLGPFDSGPTSVYQTLLRSRFVDHFQVHFMDVRFAANIGDFEKIRMAKFLRLIKYLSSMAFALVRKRYSALCIPLATNRNAFLKDSLFAWVGFTFRVPVIVLEHGTNIPALYERSGRVVRWIMRSTLKRTARCLVLAECLKFNFAPFLPADKVVSTYLGIDPTPAEEQRHAPTPSNEDCLTVLYLSTLVQPKGILVLLEAFSKVLQARKDIRLVAAGGWGRDSSEVKPQVEEWMAKKGFKDAVTFIGPVQGREKLSVLAQGDIFVLPTLVDTAPLVILEALRAGLPIISTDVGAIPEIVVEGQNGLICPSGNADELAMKILYLAERPALRQQMSRRNLECFADHFTTERFASRFIDVFESVFAETDKESKPIDVMEPSTS